MVYPIDFAYHVHTYRCKHAIGSEEEMVKNAIDVGIKFMLFSDHTPLYDSDLAPYMRMNLNELDNYIETINNLKEKYKDKIEIHLGLECEYFPEAVNFYKSLIKEKKIEVLINGQHGYFKDNDFMFHAFEYEDPIKNGEEYFKMIIAGIRSGLFKYLAHPDYIFNVMHGQGKEIALEYSKQIIKEAVEHDMILEINCQGVINSHKQRDLYPMIDFWKIVAQYPNAKVTIGVDAHSPEIFKNTDQVNYCLNIAKEAGIKKLYNGRVFWNDNN